MANNDFALDTIDPQSEGTTFYGTASALDVLPSESTVPKSNPEKVLPSEISIAVSKLEKVLSNGVSVVGDKIETDSPRGYLSNGVYLAYGGLVTSAKIYDSNKRIDLMSELINAENKISNSAMWAGVLVPVLLLLAVINFVHWALWVPPLIASIGIMISNGIQLNAIEKKKYMLLYGN